MIDTLRDNIAAAVSYSALGIGLMILGFIAVDVITPGKLRELVWVQRNRNATILVASNLLGIALIVAASISVSNNDLSDGVLYALCYGVVGIAIMTWAFVLLDWLTPGKLGQILISDEHHPAVWVSAAAHIGVGFVIAAGIL